jgi:hypothetical protein
MRNGTVLAATALLGLATACGSKNTYTLYRNGSLSDTLRIHVATFDADEEADVNRANCEQARELFQLQPSQLSRFWCEKGRYRKKAAK